jgi:hypothetical protein
VNPLTQKLELDPWVKEAATFLLNYPKPPPPRHLRPGRPKKTDIEKKESERRWAARVLSVELEIQIMFMDVLSGKRKIPERLRKEGWTPPKTLNGVQTAHVISILYGTDRRTEEKNLAKAHGLYRTNSRLRQILEFTPLFAMVDAKPAIRELLKKDFGITPRPPTRKRKRVPTA